MDKKRTVTFCAYTTFCPCDSVDWELDFEVTEEEYQRLVAASEENEFPYAEEVADIYEKVYKAAVKKSTEDFIEYDLDMVSEYIDEDESIEDWSADEVYNIGVHFPDSWDEE